MRDASRATTGRSPGSPGAFLAARARNAHDSLIGRSKARAGLRSGVTPRRAPPPEAPRGILRAVGVIDLNGIRLRNRLVTSASLLGYGASKRKLILYGLSPIAQWVPLERFGAATTRTMTLQPRQGPFPPREDWSLT